MDIERLSGSNWVSERRKTDVTFSKDNMLLNKDAIVVGKITYVSITEKYGVFPISDVSVGEIDDVTNIKILCVVKGIYIFYKYLYHRSKWGISIWI